LLSVRVRRIFEEFSELESVFRNIDYDCLDISSHTFDNQFLQFKARIEDLERRVGCVENDCIMLISP